MEKNKSHLIDGNVLHNLWIMCFRSCYFLVLNKQIEIINKKITGRLGALVGLVCKLQLKPAPRTLKLFGVWVEGGCGELGLVGAFGSGQ
jgi:hypothetical protein